MNIALFVHSVLSDWNHGNAHFLRGIITELQSRGHAVRVFEPEDAWSASNLRADHGDHALDETLLAYPGLVVSQYSRSMLDLDTALDGAELVLVHEWNDPELVGSIGRFRRDADFILLFHDTHHRSVSAPHEMSAYDLRDYDGVLAFGEAIRQRYLEAGWAAHVWTWHEAADTRVFRPLPGSRDQGLVWIGNWGDEERSSELDEFLLGPIRTLRLGAAIHGVRYPAAAIERVQRAGATYAGWLPNYLVPDAFARHRVTVHVPRRPYVTRLPGIPTIRPFEALACGIPLVTAPWEDTERLFRPGTDYLVARTGTDMTRHLRDVLNDDGLAASLAASGMQTIRERHTCAHRVDELMQVYDRLRPGRAAMRTKVLPALRPSSRTWRPASAGPIEET